MDISRRDLVLFIQNLFMFIFKVRSDMFKVSFGNGSYLLFTEYNKKIFIIQ